MLRKEKTCNIFKVYVFFYENNAYGFNYEWLNTVLEHLEILCEWNSKQNEEYLSEVLKLTSVRAKLTQYEILN